MDWIRVWYFVSHCATSCIRRKSQKSCSRQLLPDVGCCCLTSASLCLAPVSKQGVFLPELFALCCLIKSLHCLCVPRCDLWKSWGWWEGESGAVLALGEQLVSAQSSPYRASPASSLSSDCCTWDLFLQPPRYALALHFFGWNIILLLHANILWTSSGLLFFFDFSLQHFPLWNNLNLIHVPFALCSTFGTLIKII